MPLRANRPAVVAMARVGAGALPDGPVRGVCGGWPSHKA